MSLLDALSEVLEVVKTIDPADPEAAAKLETRLPAASLAPLAAKFRAGVEDGSLCGRGELPVRWSRVAKDAGGVSIDAVSMNGAGPGHEHPEGEIDLCFAVDGDPRFDGNPPGWTVYPPGSWHVPTVTGGTMDILYFLPGGAIRFGPRQA